MACVEITTPKPGIAQITLNRPEKLNALTLGVMNDLLHAVDGLGQPFR